MKIWDVDLRFGKGIMHIGKFDVDIPFGIKDTPVCNIFDFDSENIQQIWSSIPDCYKLYPYLPEGNQIRRSSSFPKGRQNLFEKKNGKPLQQVSFNEVIAEEPTKQVE